MPIVTTTSATNTANGSQACKRKKRASWRTTNGTVVASGIGRAESLRTRRIIEGGRIIGQHRSRDGAYHRNRGVGERSYSKAFRVVQAGEIQLRVAMRCGH
ncbi:hypothetical protein GCM10025759_18660 [Lysobacter panacisoli]|uniref:Uncharacterized protein n=1 Tax=Lysobacter panacisoli TaxID=1255263 RepID=A0ABP9LBV7_9GAMM